MNRITDLLNSTYGAAPLMMVNKRCVALDGSVNSKVDSIIFRRARTGPRMNEDYTDIAINSAAAIRGCAKGFSCLGGHSFFTFIRDCPN